MIFEQNKLNQVMPKSLHFDCYDGKKLIGYFEIYSDFGFINKYGAKKRKEIYIEVLEKYRHKGYAQEIYKAFLQKHKQLGLNDDLFYAYVLNKNVASIKLHTTMGFNVFKKYKIQTVFEVK